MRIYDFGFTKYEAVEFLDNPFPFTPALFLGEWEKHLPAAAGGDWTGGGACPTTEGGAGEGACTTMAAGGGCPTGER